MTCLNCARSPMLSLCQDGRQIPSSQTLSLTVVGMCSQPLDRCLARGRQAIVVHLKPSLPALPPRQATVFNVCDLAVTASTQRTQGARTTPRTAQSQTAGFCLLFHVHGAWRIREHQPGHHCSSATLDLCFAANNLLRPYASSTFSRCLFCAPCFSCEAQQGRLQ